MKITLYDIQTARETIQEDLLCFMDGWSQKAKDVACQIVVDGFEPLVSKMVDSKKSRIHRRKNGEHFFADCGGYPRCVKCGCDEDDACVGGEKCSY